jgi:hypothetical protein
VGLKVQCWAVISAQPTLFETPNFLRIPSPLGLTLHYHNLYTTHLKNYVYIVASYIFAKVGPKVIVFGNEKRFS